MEEKGGAVRLLVVTNLFPPDRGGGASVFGDLCFGLAERGWDVTVLTAYPYYPEWKEKEPHRPLEIRREKLCGVRVLRHGAYIPGAPSKLLPRLLFEAGFFASILRSAAAGGRFDAVMVFCPVLGAVCFGALRKLLFREKIWLNIQDLPAEAAAASGIHSGRVFGKLAGALQRWLFNRTDVWSSISAVMTDHLAGMTRRGQPVHLCPNWLNGSLAAAVKALENKAGRPAARPIRLLYAGNIGKKQGLLEFCQRFSQMHSPFHLRIAGDGGEAAAVGAWIGKRADERFSFGEFLDEQGFARALFESDLFVITERPGSGASFIPSKLIPCIATGTPIIAVCDASGPLGREVAEHGLGFVVEWGQIECLPAVLESFSSQPGLLAQIQARCLAHARHYQRETAIGRFDTLLRAMAKA